MMRNRLELDSDAAQGNEEQPRSRRKLKRKQEKLAAWQKKAKEFLNGIIISRLSLSRSTLTDYPLCADPHRERRPEPSPTTMLPKAMGQSRSEGSRTEKQPTIQRRMSRSQIATNNSKKKQSLNLPVEDQLSGDQSTFEASPPDPPVTPAASASIPLRRHPKSISRPDWVDRYSKNSTPGEKKTHNIQLASDGDEFSEETSDEEVDSGSEESVNPITPDSSQRHSLRHQRSRSTAGGGQNNPKKTTNSLPKTSRRTQGAKSHDDELASPPV